jgi:hypothetical protein
MLIPMPVGNPHHKGTGLLPIVEGLRKIPDARRLVPKDLWHYLDGTVLPSTWYPERHVAVLVDALASTMDAKVVGGSAWEHIGRQVAQRDLVGELGQTSARRSSPPESGRQTSSGLYRQFLKEDVPHPSSFFLRASKLWQLYHDTGKLEALRRADADGVVVLRLSDFRFPAPGMEELQSAYLREFARLSGLRLDMQLVKSPARGHPHYEWDSTVDTTADVTAWIRSLPVA